MSKQILAEEAAEEMREEHLRLARETQLERQARVEQEKRQAKEERQVQDRKRNERYAARSQRKE